MPECKRPLADKALVLGAELPALRLLASQLGIFAR